MELAALNAPRRGRRAVCFCGPPPCHAHGVLRVETLDVIEHQGRTGEPVCQRAYKIGELRQNI